MPNHDQAITGDVSRKNFTVHYSLTSINDWWFETDSRWFYQGVE